MTKISKKAAYPIKTPIDKDYFVGSDSEMFGKTVNFSFEETASLISKLNGSLIVNYLFKVDNNIPLEVLTEGVFLSENNETEISSITKLYVNKKNASGDDLADLFTFLKANKNSFMFKLQNSEDLQNACYFNITNVVDHADYFIFSINVFIQNQALQNLIHFNVYFFSFDIKSASGQTTEDKFTSVGTISLIENEITLSVGFNWIINQEEYANITDYSETVPFSSSGMQRFVLFVANAFNTFEMISGPESVSNPIVPPVPNNTLQTTLLLVTDGIISDPTDPIIGDLINSKLDKDTYTGTAKTLDDSIKNLLPVGLRGQIIKVQEENTNKYEVSELLLQGKYIETDEELDAAKLTFVTQEEIFNTWKRYSHGDASVNPTVSVLSNLIPGTPLHTNSWIYNDSLSQIESTINSGDYIGFVSNTLVKDYSQKATLGASNSDNDRIGFVLFYEDLDDLVDNNAYGLDPADFDWDIDVTSLKVPNQHTLSFLRNRESLTRSFYVIYNSGKPGNQIIANGSASGIWNTLDAWNVGGINRTVDISVIRSEDIITFRTSNFSDAPGGKGGLDFSLSVDLNSLPILEKFKGFNRYGFLAQSQANAFFTDIEVSEDVNTIFDVRNGDVWSIDSSGEYVIDPDRNLYDEQNMALVFNEITKKTIYLKNNDYTVISSLQDISDKADVTYVDAQDADVLNDSKDYTDSLISQLLDGVPADGNTLKELNDKIIAVQAIIGGTAPDGDSIVNTVTELLAVFATFPEGVDLVTLLAGKVNTTDVYNALDCIIAGKVLDARQGKVLNDLIVALTTTVGLKENSSNKTSTVNGNEASTTLFSNLLGFTTWIKNYMSAWVGAHATAIVDADNFFIGKSGVLGTRTFAQLKSTLGTLFQVKDNQITISANSNVLNAWDGETVFFDTNCTITVPTSLNASFGFNFIVKVGVTVSWAITSPHVWIGGTPSATISTTKPITGNMTKEGSGNNIYLFT